MEIKAKAKFIRMSPKKVRLLADLIRGNEILSSLDQLKFANKAAALPVSKLVKSAVANASHNYEIKEDNLFIKEIKVDGGPSLKRWAPKAHGRATPIRKHSCHITLVLGEIKDSGVKKAKSQKIEAPIKLGEKPKQDEVIKTEKTKDIKKAKKTDEFDALEEKGKVVDTRNESRKGHSKVEGGAKGFVGKMFHRKSG